MARLATLRYAGMLKGISMNVPSLSVAHRASSVTEGRGWKSNTLFIQIPSETVTASFGCLARWILNTRFRVSCLNSECDFLTQEALNLRTETQTLFTLT